MAIVALTQLYPCRIISSPVFDERDGKLIDSGYGFGGVVVFKFFLG